MGHKYLDGRPKLLHFRLHWYIHILIIPKKQSPWTAMVIIMLLEIGGKGIMYLSLLNLGTSLYSGDIKLAIDKMIVFVFHKYSIMIQ